MTATFRLARPEDLPSLPRIELSANAVFLPPGSTESETGRATPAESWKDLCQAGSIWVIEEDGGELIGFLAAEVEGQDIHLVEFDVRRHWQGRGLGRALLRHVIDWANSQGLRRMTLITSTNVAWNAPFYESVGFAQLGGSELSGRLAQRFEEDLRETFAPEHRCAMALELAQGDQD